MLSLTVIQTMLVLRGESPVKKREESSRMRVNEL